MIMVSHTGISSQKFVSCPKPQGDIPGRRLLTVVVLQNVLVAAQGPDWRVQITDFGITKRIQDGHTAQFTMGQGTHGFMAPEMIISTLTGSAYALDMWSLGCMAYYMLTNRVPVVDLRDLHRYGSGAAHCVGGDYSRVVVTRHAKEFVSKLLARDPNDRLSADEALSHEWIRWVFSRSTHFEHVPLTYS